MEKKTILNFEGSAITFENKNGRVMVNATEMAKKFGKLPHEWLRLPSTTEFLSVLTNARKSLICDYQAVTTTKGAPQYGGGTWLDEDAAIEFARWLSPVFAIWCNDRIKELLKVGITALNASVIEKVLNDPDSVIKIFEALKKEKAKRIQVEAELDSFLHSNNSYSMTEVAKELGLRSGLSLKKWLVENHVVYRKGQTWLTHAKYSTQGYTVAGHEKNGKKLVYTNRWTEKGRRFVKNLYNEKTALLF